MDEHERALWDREAATWIGPVGRRVADLGCGTGTLSTLLALEGQHVLWRCPTPRRRCSAGSTFWHRAAR